LIDTDRPASAGDKTMGTNEVLNMLGMPREPPLMPRVLFLSGAVM
jgi:hypothetical protein